jgi:hypothetical protein
LNIGSKKTNDFTISKKEKKEWVSEKELNFELGLFLVFNPKFFLLLEMCGPAKPISK